jgi:hypothetical protein
MDADKREEAMDRRNGTSDPEYLKDGEEEEDFDSPEGKCEWCLYGPSSYCSMEYPIPPCEGGVGSEGTNN